MNTMTINTKFAVGDMVYLMVHENVIIPCPICEGAKKIEYNGKMMTCPECRGAGEFKSDKQAYRPVEKPFKVSNIKLSVGAQDSVSVRYKVDGGYKTLARAEENVFATIEECQAICDELNKERKYMELNNIVVPDMFARTIPAPSKIAERVGYYRRHNKFNTEINVDNEGVIIDGYATYLVCKMLGIDMVKVVVSR